MLGDPTPVDIVGEGARPRAGLVNFEGPLFVERGRDVGWLNVVVDPHATLV